MDPYRVSNEGLKLQGFLPTGTCATIVVSVVVVQPDHVLRMKKKIKAVHL